MNKENITYQDRLDELLLDIKNLKSNSKIFILVEGESDVKLFRKLFHEENCKVEYIPGGKFKLEECVDHLIKQHSLLIGIRDADFLRLEDLPYVVSNMFLTDHHDIEMMIFSEDELFSALIGEHTSLSKGMHLGERNKILNSIKQIGLLKWLNEKENLEYKFETGFFGLLSFENTIDFNLYFPRLLSKSPNAKITDINNVSNKIACLEQLNPDLFQLCNGHDFLSALSQYLREVRRATNVNEKNIASACRIAYTRDHYQKSALYQNTKKWADKNNCVIY